MGFGDRFFKTWPYVSLFLSVGLLSFCVTYLLVAGFEIAIAITTFTAVVLIVQAVLMIREVREYR